MYSINETIVALATPPGEGALGIIRLSGKDAIAITDKIFRGKKLALQPSHTIHFGRIIAPSVGGGKGEALDEVVVSLYRAPKSYTGEDVVEISCHGSNYILEQVIKLCAESGATPAKPGEFTQRAFLNSKLDLTQAEAVADLIASQSSASHHAAMHNLRGGFSHDLKDIREELIKFSALIELELDFSQEDVEFADRTQLQSLIHNATFKIQNLLDSFRLGNAIKQGIKVAIIGKPNAGKSTLLNALLNEERAIVSDIAGTTRDTIEEVLNIRGVLFRIIDTAGIREHSTDVIENIGMARSRKAMQEADVVVYLFDVNEQPETVYKDVNLLKMENNKLIIAGNKADEQGLTAAREKFYELLDDDTVLFISAREKENIETLKEKLYELSVGGDLNQEGTIVTNSRHHAALQEVQRSLQEIQTGMDNQLPGDLIALDIRRCLYFLGEITGEITTEDKLDYIFSKFCIGK
jgi:tRNA modification GTPase